MNDFQYGENFEPSSNTKEWCLYTHKSEQLVAGVPLPGLFHTTYYEWQMIGFVCIFLLEGIATYWVFREGVIITAILASIFVDLVLAIIAHVFQKEICRKKNQLVYEDEREAGATKRRLKFLLLKQRFFYLLILVSAFFKIYWFLNVYGILDATTLFIMTCYIIGALLHMTCTGYAIFTFIFNRKIGREHNQYIDSKGESFAFDPKSPMPYQLNSTDLTIAEAGRHKIAREKDGDFYLYTYGVLTDAELRQLIGKQIKPDQKRTVAIEGAKHQMFILTKDPERGVKK